MENPGYRAASVSEEIALRVTLRHFLSLCPRPRHAAEPTQASGFSLKGVFIAFEGWGGRHHLRAPEGRHRVKANLA